MARKGSKGRKSRRYLKGNVDEGLSLGTLAALTLVSATFDESVEERTLISSIKVSYEMQEFTVASGDGPIVVGVAHSDYSDAEIEEVLENTGSWSEGDLVAQEVAKRKVRIIGQFEASNQAGGAYVLNDGKPITTKLNWILTTGKTLKLWCYNAGSSPLATTIPIVRAQGHCNLWPQ